MKKLVRVGLLIVVIVLGFTVVFPEWFDFKDQIVAEQRREKVEAERRQQEVNAKQRYAAEEVALEALQPHAQAFAREIWRAVDARDYAAPFDRGTSRFRGTQEPDGIERLRSIHEAVGPELDAREAASRPGYAAAATSRVYSSHGPKLIVESRRWSRNAVLVRTLELERESEQLRVDAILLEVLAYSDAEDSIARDMHRIHVFR